MSDITTLPQLRESIALLKIQRKADELAMKEQFKSSYESLRPANLIKNTLSELVSGPDLKAGLLSTVMSLASGYLSRKFVTGSSSNPLKQVMGTLVQHAVSGLVSANADGIKNFVSNLAGSFLHKKEKSSHNGTE